jgi:prepilin-type processing-associated H-X9-DG protein
LARNKSGQGPTFRVAPKEQQTWGWAYQILPYVDEQATYNKDSIQAPAQQDAYFGSPTQTALKIYNCPSRRTLRLLNNQINGTTVCTIDYAGNGGPFTFWNPDGTPMQGSPANGPWINYGPAQFGTVVKLFSMNGNTPVPVSNAIRFDDITDGQAYTLLVAEKRWNNAYDKLAQFSAQAPTDFIGFTCGYGLDTIRTAGSGSPTVGNYSGAFGTTIPRLDDSDAAAVPPNIHPDGFGSAHRTGFNALFADGSVRHIRYDMSDDFRTTPKYSTNPGVTLFQRLCDRADTGTVDPRMFE